MKTILSLCDYSGNWPRPYLDAGYSVILVDPKHKDGCGEPRGPSKIGATVHQILNDPAWREFLPNVHGVLAAPPCTDFSVSGAQYWKVKDEDGRTERSLQIVKDCLGIIKVADPDWWVLENPVGRLPKLLPEIGKPWYFQPHWYGDPWTKKTGLWGDFNTDLPRNDVEPIRWTKQGSWTQRYGGSSEKTKEARSMTPMGFAKAFFEANP
jgi:hypothetical protein